MSVQDLHPLEIAALIDKDKSYTVIDVREQWEYEIVHLPNSRLLPMSNFVQLLPTLDSIKPYIIYCHHGIRSMQVCMYLSRLGFENLINMAGGIDTYALDVDNTLPRY